MKIIANLVGSQGRAGLISKETIATVLEVSESTVSRWTRGDGIPNSEVFRQLRWLERQRGTWYLRFCDFVLAMWSPPREVVEDDFDEQLAKDRYFSEITYRPTDNPSVVICELKLEVAFQAFALVVLGPRRHQLVLSHVEEGSGARTLHFVRQRKVAPRRGRFTLRKGSKVTFYLRYLV